MHTDVHYKVFSGILVYAICLTVLIEACVTVMEIL